jgi:hypothetical protein
LFFSLIAAAIESNLMALEACNVIALRGQVIAKGDARALEEVELMSAEKLDAFAQAGFDMAAGVSNLIIRDNFRAAIRANQLRLNAVQRPA